MRITLFLVLISISLLARSITINDFVKLDPKVQQGYLIGVIDREGIHNSPDSGFDKCALNWLKSESHNDIKESFELGLSSMNTAMYVSLELKKYCKESYEYTDSLHDD